MREYVLPMRQSGAVRTELIAGATTFLAMAYIIFVQPAVLSGATLGTDTGMDFGAVTTATCLSAALATLIMGLLVGPQRGDPHLADHHGYTVLFLDLRRFVSRASVPITRNGE